MVVTREVVLTVTLNTGQTAYVFDQCPVEGKITQVIREWPDGSNHLLDIAIGHEGIWMLPNLTDVYVALNDATTVIQVNEKINRGEKLWARFRNRDAFWPHTPTVTFVVEGEP